MTAVAKIEPVPLEGLFERHLTLSDLARSIDFYRDVVGLPLAFPSAELGATFFWIGGPGEAMVGLWANGSAPIGLSLHLAFKTSVPDVLDAGRRLRSFGVTPLSPDGHLLEYLAMLDTPPAPERGIVSWSEWAA